MNKIIYFFSVISMVCGVMVFIVGKLLYDYDKAKFQEYTQWLAIIVATLILIGVAFKLLHKANND